MENRFQEALDELFRDENLSIKGYINSYILQELIDNYEKLETKCFDLEQELECIYDDPKQDLEESITDLDIKNQKLEEENIKLEKALDKACEWITDNDGWVNIFGNDDFRDRFPNGVKTKEDWKEYLLKESEKQ